MQKCGFQKGIVFNFGILTGFFKVQISGTALIFLALLYNSPSGLVLYWTLNNIFSLVKNILVKAKYARQWIYGILFTGAVFLDIYVLFSIPGICSSGCLPPSSFPAFFLRLSSKRRCCSRRSNLTIRISVHSKRGGMLYP
jgi:hypothetical protein